jgi:multicomponent Na+:H+ antiporter subunit E
VNRNPSGKAATVARFLALALWAYLVWVILTWTLTLEQLVFGAILALAVAAAMTAIGEVGPPWRVLDPRRLVGAVILLLASLVRIVRANVDLARRIWSPRRPLASGMVVVPTSARSDAMVGFTGLITSLIVDNQVVNVDRKKHLLQYHAITVPEGSGAQKAKEINLPTEQLLTHIDPKGASG